MTSVPKPLPWLPPPSGHSQATEQPRNLPHPALPLSVSPPTPSSSHLVHLEQSLCPLVFLLHISQMWSCLRAFTLAVSFL